MILYFYLFWKVSLLARLPFLSSVSVVGVTNLSQSSKVLPIQCPRERNGFLSRSPWPMWVGSMWTLGFCSLSFKHDVFSGSWNFWWFIRWEKIQNSNFLLLLFSGLDETQSLLHTRQVPYPEFCTVRHTLLWKVILQQLDSWGLCSLSLSRLRVPPPLFLSMASRKGTVGVLRPAPLFLIMLRPGWGRF